MRDHFHDLQWKMWVVYDDTPPLLLKMSLLLWQDSVIGYVYQAFWFYICFFVQPLLIVSSFIEACNVTHNSFPQNIRSFFIHPELKCLPSGEQEIE